MWRDPCYYFKRMVDKGQAWSCVVNWRVVTLVGRLPTPQPRRSSDDTAPVDLVIRS